MITLPEMPFVLALISFLCLDAQAHFVPYRMTMMNQLQVDSYCLASLVGSPHTSCLPYEGNVKAFPSYDASRRYIFAGSADNLLNVNDADSGEPVSKIEVFGRVVTETIFDNGNGLLYFGTDKGKFYALDAYSFKTVFSLDADSSINNNITIVDDLVIFTSSVGTVFAVDGKTGEIKWQLSQPLKKDRLRMMTQSNIVKAVDETNPKTELRIVPNSDGYVSVIDASSGKIKKKIELGTFENANFPDIVAPMVALKNRLWIASHDLGIAVIDLSGLRIREQISINGVLDLVTDGDAIFLATTDAIYRLNENGAVVWKNNISTIKSRTPRAAFPFDNFSQGAKRMFFGVPVGMLVEDKHLVLAYSLGSLGIFDKTNGRPVGSLGHSVQFSAIEWAGPKNIAAISKRGLLMKFRTN